MAETTEATDNPNLAPLEEKVYIVALHMVVPGFDPVDAVKMAINRLAVEGVTNQTMRAFDNETEVTYLVPAGQTTYYEDPDILAEQEAAGEVELEALLPLLGQLSGVYGSEFDEAIVTAFQRPTVDVELPEPEPAPEEKPKAKRTRKKKDAEPAAPVTGPCIRCKEENVLNEDGLCPECLVDMEGLSS
jgi:hypothetical protein